MIKRLILMLVVLIAVVRGFLTLICKRLGIVDRQPLCVKSRWPKLPKRALGGVISIFFSVLAGVFGVYLFLQAVAPLEKSAPMKYLEDQLLVLMPQGISEIRLYLTLKRDESFLRAAKQPINYPLIFTTKMKAIAGSPECLPFVLVATGEAVFGEGKGELWFRSTLIKSVEEEFVIWTEGYNEEHRMQIIRVNACINEDRDYGAALEFTGMQGVMLSDNGRSTFYRLPSILAFSSGMAADRLLKVSLNGLFPQINLLRNSGTSFHISDCRVNLGWLSALERVEARPPIKSAGEIIWEDEDCIHPKTALVSNVTREENANIRLFLSGVLISLAVSLLVFGIERLIETCGAE